MSSCVVVYSPVFIRSTDVEFTASKLPYSAQELRTQGKTSFYAETLGLGFSAKLWAATQTDYTYVCVCVGSGAAMGVGRQGDRAESRRPASVLPLKAGVLID